MARGPESCGGRMPKVTIVGAGQTGATTAHWIAERDLADVVLIDVVEGMPQGKGLDLAQAMPIIGSDSRVSGTNDYAETAGSDIVIITAGLPRKPGMSRDDLLEANSKIVREAVQQSLAASPEAILVILTNPLDAMAFLAMKVGGVPLADALPPERLEAIVDRTRKGGGEIVSLLKTGSAFYAPAAALAQMVEAILRNRHLTVPAAAYLEGEYGQRGIFFGVPVQLGAGGLEKIVEYDLNAEERAALEASAGRVRETIEALKLGEH